ncbi:MULTISPECIES: LPO_1073/Vpar_1526 family protein [Providencia]|uniref:LPO_1073/Vpar_1526 family protein n=1 Tax=Providencia TaxID=586 RepID=UPI00234BB7AF|nr:LPO_1073/Vpar_1526 family protein [Providencia sp. PROV038]
MSIIDKSGQHVGNNSSAIQVTGNATIGNSTTEVMEICRLVVMEKFSALREDAMSLAIQRAQEFAVNITERLNSELDDKIEKKLKDPDLQFAIGEATTIVAKKGDKTKSELLQEIIVSKIHNENEETDLLLDHALEMTKRLTTSEIKLLAFISYFRQFTTAIEGKSIYKIIRDYNNDIVHPTVTLETCHSIYQHRFNLVNPTLNKIIIDLSSISPVNINHLEIKGCLSSGKHYTESSQKIISEFSGLTIDSDEQFSIHFPDFNKIINAFGLHSLSEFDKVVTNDLGDIIAENFIRAQGGLN